MSPNSKQSVAALFSSPDAAELGINAASSQIMINNLNATTLPMCMGAPIHTLESDDVIIIMFAIDRSPSMLGVRQILIDAFNELLIDGLRGASKKTANTIVVGGLTFSSDVTPLWGGGFKKLQEVPRLTLNDYDPDAGRATALYQGQLDALTAASAYAAQVFQETGTMPRVIVVGMSDGANNVSGVKASDVLAITSSLSREICKLPFVVFETYEHVDGKQIAQDTGFEVFESKKLPGESDEDVKRRFRHMMGTLSSQVISASQANVGGAAATSQSFWQTT